MVASSPSSTQAHVQKILRTTAAHFAIHLHQGRSTPHAILIASEFKDPIRLRWTTSPPSQRVTGRCGISI